MLTLNDLLDDIAQARARQITARAALEHSPNPDTIDAEKAATRELNVLLDRLLLTTR
jgi:hypothetical protein